MSTETTDGSPTRWQRFKVKHPEKLAKESKRVSKRRRDRYATDPEFRERIKAYSKARYAANKDTINARRYASENYRTKSKAHNRTDKHRRLLRDRKYRGEYGITLEQYEAILASQNGVCAICWGTASIKDRWNSGINNLQVDHDHETGAVRGLLCFNCNTGLGHFRDNPELLTKALTYLSK